MPAQNEAMPPPIISLPQNRETESCVDLIPPLSSDAPVLALTYVYARSRDTRDAGAAGQDFVAWQWDEARIVFAICDGVSQSFYGEIAARFLGLRLVAALWEGQIAQIDTLLRDWAADASHEIATKVINPDLPDMQRVALQRKRENGSESMFIAGLVDRAANRAELVWMGDMRVWVWDVDGMERPIPGAAFETKERWSTRIGPKNGAPRKATIPLDGIAHLTAHSDGVGSFAPRLNAISQDLLNSIVTEQTKAPASDDISVFDLDFNYPPIFGVFTALPTPAPRQASPAEPVLIWDHVRLATRYRVAVEDTDRSITADIDATVKLDEDFRGYFTYFLDLPMLALTEAPDSDRILVCRVQALNDYTYPSQWSAPIEIRLIPQPEAIPASITDTQPSATGRASKGRQKKATTGEKKSRVHAALIVLISCVVLVGLIVAGWLALTVFLWNGLTP